MFAPANQQFGREAVSAFAVQLALPVFNAVADSFVFEWHVAAGRTPADIYLARTDVSLHPAARTYLEAARRAALDLLEVAGVTSGESIVFRDLLAERTIAVIEHRASRQLRCGKVLFARIAEMPGKNFLTGVLYPLDRRVAERIVELLQAEKRRPENRGPTWQQFLHRNWQFVPTIWLAHNVDPAPRTGEPRAAAGAESSGPIDIARLWRELDAP